MNPRTGQLLSTELSGGGGADTTSPGSGGSAALQEVGGGETIGTIGLADTFHNGWRVSFAVR
ncbi:MAG TPA: hypothetical protein VEZ88_14490 [Steroidobacteraceae bacterium]|nr:hypothetical protein [Steroidobacteraceae bacterium]